MSAHVMMTVLVLCVLLVLLAAGAEVEAGAKEAAVRDVFREMLHIQPPRVPGGGRHRPAPRHMLELYQQYSNTQPAEGATTTVRNIMPSAGTDLLMFNVSSVQYEEEVRLAQLQLNRRRLHQRHHHSRRLLAPPYRVKLYQVSAGRSVPLASVPVSMVQRSAWGAVDVTAAVRELLLDPKASRHLLAVRFESPTGKAIPPSHFLRGVPDMYAFLVVFTEDSEENEVSEDGGDPSPKPAVHTHAIVQKLHSQHAELFRDEDDNTPQIIPVLDEIKERRVFTRNNTSITNHPTAVSTSRAPYDAPKHRFTPGELLRKTRSIADNQLPDDDDAVDTHVPRTSPESTLMTRADLPRHVEGSGRKPRKGKKGKRKRGKKQKNLSPPDSWQNVYQRTEETPGGCTVRKMTVNFSEIGWGEWIISPEKIDANYCTGSCRFPLTKKKDIKRSQAVKPSNHATLQSLVHALGHNPLVPAPACVPHHMTAVTLLFFDDSFNVVLKNYPSMVVDSCACR